jgi:hypothetical protein
MAYILAPVHGRGGSGPGAEFEMSGGEPGVGCVYRQANSPHSIPYIYDGEIFDIGGGSVSILGTLLFVVFINDLDEAVESVELI